MYAIVKTGGKQYRVERGQRLLVERLPADEGASVALEPILYRSEEAVFDADGLKKVKVTAKIARPRARREAARLQVQAQARLQAAHWPPPGADPHRGHRHLAGRGAKASAKPAAAAAHPAESTEKTAKPAAAKAPAKPAAAKKEDTDGA